MFGGMEDDDDSTHFMHTRMPGGMPGKMPSSSSRPRPGFRQSSSPFASTASAATPSEPSEITRPLQLSLEELYSGTTKHLKVGRRLLGPPSSTDERILEIAVPPGWKSGTKVRFPRAGNEIDGGRFGGEPVVQDLVFVVEEKPHARFVREGNDLVTHEKISLVDALANSGGMRTVEVLDGRKIQVPLPSGIIKPGSESKVAGEGMPIRKEGSTRKKGDLIVKWDIVFPDRLTPAQREGIRKVLS